MTNIGRYELIAQLGAGAMGAVYRANDTVLDRHVALKTLSAASARDPELLERFYREAKIGAKLRHPNIVTVYDLGQEQGIAYMAMELIDGPDLRRVIAGGAAMPLEQKLRVVAGVSEGLTYSHSMGVIHRDIKPGNILIDKDGRPQIVDFGVAHTPASSLTMAGRVLGTPHYMSPEQMSGQSCDERSDIFSLAVVVFEFFTGKHPFDGQAVNHLAATQSDPLLLNNCDLPQAMLAVLRRALSRTPETRYSSAVEFANALRSAAENIHWKPALDESLVSGPPPRRLGGTETILSAVLVNLQKFEEASDRGDLSGARQAMLAMRRAGADDTRYAIALEQSSKRLAELESAAAVHVEEHPAFGQVQTSAKRHGTPQENTPAHIGAPFNSASFVPVGLDATSFFELPPKGPSEPVQFPACEVPLSIPISAPVPAITPPSIVPGPATRRIIPEMQPPISDRRKRQRDRPRRWPLGVIAVGLLACALLVMGLYFIKTYWRQEPKRLPAVATAEVINIEAPLFASPGIGQAAIATAHHGDVVNVLRAPRNQEQQWTEVQWISAGHATPALFVRTVDLGKWSSSDSLVDETLRRMFSVASVRSSATAGEKTTGGNQH